MSQKDVIKQIIAGGKQSIAEIAASCNILRPNIRRILGEGAKAGEFSRVARGVYVLKDGDRQVAWVECGEAGDVLKDLADSGEKYDMVFLDPAYYSPELIGRNRLKKIDWYNFIMPQQFYEVMQQVARLTRNPDSHVYLMLSGARSAQKDMQKYAEAAIWAGFTITQEGSYVKTYANGEPVLNIRGKVAAGERIILLNQSGQVGDVTMDFQFPRPKGYHTQKPEGLLRQLIQQSTKIFDHILDPFAGSGVTGKVALQMQRRVTLIDHSEDAIQNHILRNLNVLI